MARILRSAIFHIYTGAHSIALRAHSDISKQIMEGTVEPMTANAHIAHFRETFGPHAPDLTELCIGYIKCLMKWKAPVVQVTGKALREQILAAIELFKQELAITHPAHHARADYFKETLERAAQFVDKLN